MTFFENELIQQRCGPTLNGSGPYDIAVNQATQVLEFTLRKHAEHQGKETGHVLVSAVLNGDPLKAKVIISNDPAEQEGFANLCRGIMQYYRNPSHHDIRDISLNEATAVCLLVDQLVQKIERSFTREQIEEIVRLFDQLSEQIGG